MQSNGYIEATKDPVEFVMGLLNFFGVSSVAAWKGYWEERVAAARFKRAGQAPDKYAVAAWLRRGDVAGAERDCEPWASRPVEFHHQPLPELSVTLSRHSAPIRQTCRSGQTANARRDARFAEIKFAESGTRVSCEL